MSSPTTAEPLPAPSEDKRVRVDLGHNSYDIVIGTGLLDRAPAFLQGILSRPRTVIVTDTDVAAHHLEPLEASLRSAGIKTDSIVLPSGEATKSFDQLSALCDRLLDLGVERQDVVIALGGGVIGDLTGFAAAILRRGIGFIQCPTTLLAQVDSAVGGKTGINTAHGKNLIGAFHQPRLVVSDTATLSTLPDRELRAGFAEVIKYGAIDDEPFFTWLETMGADVLNRNPAALAEAIGVSCRAKARIVAADEREGGVRALLNLGHTFAHALEAESGYGGDLLHGEAVAAGMVLAFDLSIKLGFTGEPAAARLRALLQESALPCGFGDLPRPYEAEALVTRMFQDKKTVGERLTFILARDIGQAFIETGVEPRVVQTVLEEKGAIPC